MAARYKAVRWLALAATIGLFPAAVHAAPVGRVTGVGGVFVKS